MKKLPKNVDHPAIYCPTVVTLDHFKFVDGLQSYLKTRWQTYKSNHLAWWKDSWRFLTHIERNNNTICVDCSKSKCYNTLNGKKLAAIPSKKFYCGKDRQSCSTLAGFHMNDVDSNAYKMSILEENNKTRYR